MSRTQEQEWNENQVVDDDEDDDMVFVLTDEWREFFAKSEAKRILGKNIFKLQCYILFVPSLVMEYKYTS